MREGRREREGERRGGRGSPGTLEGDLSHERHFLLSGVLRVFHEGEVIAVQTELPRGKREW